MSSERRFYLKCISAGAVFTIVFAAVVFLFTDSKGLAMDLLFYETLPFYSLSEDNTALFRMNISNEETAQASALFETEDRETAELIREDDISFEAGVTEPDVTETGAEQAGNSGLETIIKDYDPSALIHEDDLSYATEEDERVPSDMVVPTQDDIEQLRDLEYLRQSIYTVEESTGMLTSDFDVDSFLSADLSIDTSDGLPKVLITHGHSQETYKDSRPGEVDDTILGVGERLADILRERYGILSVHNTTAYDLVDGVNQRDGSYDRMDPDVRMLLERYPSIEVVLDVHRDGVDEALHLATEVDGKPTARIMFVNGLSKTNTGGVIEEISYLPNPNLGGNLAFSFNLQLEANALYPGFTRKVYLKTYRYSTHLKPKSALIEVGAQTNTVEEAKNAMSPLADVLAAVLLSDK